MSEIKEGGPAFPSDPKRLQIIPDGTAEHLGFYGMSLRDWFAGMALQGILANPVLTASFASATKDPEKGIGGMVKMAKMAANAMLQARQNEKKVNL